MGHGVAALELFPPPCSTPPGGYCGGANVSKVVNFCVFQHKAALSTISSDPTKIATYNAPLQLSSGFRTLHAEIDRLFFLWKLCGSPKKSGCSIHYRARISFKTHLTFVTS
jgi:hypothetical protein